MNNLNLIDFIQYIAIYLFYGYLTLIFINYIIKSIIFIGPMKRQYKIMVSDISNDIKDRYWLFILFFIAIVFFMVILYKINIILFTITLAIYLLDILYLVGEYKKLNLLHFINEFSEDLFDWKKIYELPIDDTTKKQCFYIHHLDYDKFEEKYINELKVKLDKYEY